MNAVAAELAKYGRMLWERGLASGTGGNISARDGAHMWVKPGHGALGELTAQDYVAVDIASGVPRGTRRPSSEFKMHLAIYRVRPDVQAVFHTHSPWATGAASSRLGFEPIVIEAVGYLGRIATLPYYLTSSQDLADAVGRAARERDTILLMNHGVVLLGPDPRAAFQRCEIIEESAKALVAARILGGPRRISSARIAELRNLGKK
jgi:L-fuculose-phosphate aldolase